MRNRNLLRLVLYAWASPTTLVGLVAGLVTLCSGGSVQRRRGALEFHGGLARAVADWIGFGAMTLGHVIIGRDPWCLDVLPRSRAGPRPSGRALGVCLHPGLPAGECLGMVAGGALLFRQLVRTRRAASLR